ncbi:MAG: PaaI family thioesterase, partial [Enterococcus thailandicus]|nr:PaaI family thioesterase [Enterococcus thailandicus]
MNLLEHLQIKTLELSPEKVVLSLDIHAIHLQPYGYLHGGINGVLIETACSLGAN